MTTHRRPAGVFVVARLSGIALPARAQTGAGPQTVDTVRGTIKGSTRFIGLGGAFVAIADDTEGVPHNPASTAVRLPYSWDAWSFAFGIDDVAAEERHLQRARKRRLEYEWLALRLALDRRQLRARGVRPFGGSRVRAGSYLELPTTAEGNARVHGTGGVDVKLFRWDVFGWVHPFDYWQLSLAADGAKSYLETSFSVGFWH